MLDRGKFVPSGGDAEDTVGCCTGYARASARQDKPSGNRQQFSTFAKGGRGEKASSAGSSSSPPTHSLIHPPPPSYPLGAVSSSPHLRPVHLASSSLFVRLSCARKFLQFLSLLIHPPPRAFILLLSFRRTTRLDATLAEGTRCGLVRRSSKV